MRDYLIVILPVLLVEVGKLLGRHLDGKREAMEKKIADLEKRLADIERRFK